MSSNVLGDDHLLRLRLVHKGQEIRPLLIRNDDLIPLSEKRGSNQVININLSTFQLTLSTFKRMEVNVYSLMNSILHTYIDNF